MNTMPLVMSMSLDYGDDICDGLRLYVATKVGVMLDYLAPLAVSLDFISLAGT